MYCPLKHVAVARPLCQLILSSTAPAVPHVPSASQHDGTTPSAMVVRVYRLAMPSSQLSPSSIRPTSLVISPFPRAFCGRTPPYPVHRQLLCQDVDRVRRHTLEERVILRLGPFVPRQMMSLHSERRPRPAISHHSGWKCESARQGGIRRSLV